MGNGESVALFWRARCKSTSLRGYQWAKAHLYFFDSKAISVVIEITYCVRS
jgi:hypothetical protein